MACCIAIGVEAATGMPVKAWASASENYTCGAVPARTKMFVDQDGSVQMEDFMTDAWPRALGLIKKLSESPAREA